MKVQDDFGWGLLWAAHHGVLARGRNPNGVVAVEYMGCSRTVAMDGRTFWSMGGWPRHTVNGMFQGGNVMFGDGAVRWFGLSEGFGADFGGGSGNYVNTFYSLPWHHWYKSHQGIVSSTLPAPYADYNGYYK